MELKLNSGDVITIPDDCKAVIKDKIITVEKEVQEFKDGDFCAFGDKHFFWVYIYKSEKNYYSSFYHAFIGSDSDKPSYDNSCAVIAQKIRLATEEEKQFLLDALHADWKDWDADKKQIVDYRWKPKIGDTYYFIDRLLDVYDCLWDSDSADNLAYSRGNCFKTKEEAQMYAGKFSEILKERKL